MNLGVQAIMTDNQRINRELGEWRPEELFGPEPMEPAKNYKTNTGYKAVVRDISSFDTYLIIQHGRITDIEERPF